MGSQFHHGYVSRGPPIILDGRVSQVQFETLAVFRGPSQVREVKALVRIRPCPSWFAHSLVSRPAWALRRFYQAGHPPWRRNRQVSGVASPNLGVTSIGETCPASSEGITPPSSLLPTRAPNPIWLSSASTFGLVRGSFAGCYQPLLSAGSSRRYLWESFLWCLGPYHDGWQIAHTWFFLCHSGLPHWKMGRLTVTFRLSDFTAGRVFEIAAISLCSSLTVCSPPWSLLPRRFPAGQLVTFTSGQNVLCYRRTHRIC